MTLFLTSFVVAPHCTEGMPFAMGIPLGEMGVSNAKASRKVMSLSIFISCLFLSVLTHPRPLPNDLGRGDPPVGGSGRV